MITEQELKETIAELIRYADTSENPILIPKSLKEDYLKAADQIHNLYKEAGYVRQEEEADKVARLLERGWIPPEEARSYVQLSPDQSLPVNPHVEVDCNGRFMGYDADKANVYGGAQNDMLKVGFRKVK